MRAGLPALYLLALQRGSFSLPPAPVLLQVEDSQQSISHSLAARLPGWHRVTLDYSCEFLCHPCVLFFFPCPEHLHRLGGQQLEPQSHVRDAGTPRMRTGSCDLILNH